MPCGISLVEADPARGDSDEALTYCYQPTRTVLEVRGEGGDWQNVGGMVGPMLFRRARYWTATQRTGLFATAVHTTR